MRRTSSNDLIFAVVLVVAWIMGWLLADKLMAQDREVYVQSFTIGHHEAWDSRDIKFIELKTPKGNLLLSGDAELPLTQWCVEHMGAKVIVTVEEAPGR